LTGADMSTTQQENE